MLSRKPHVRRKIHLEKLWPQNIIAKCKTEDSVFRGKLYISAVNSLQMSKNIVDMFRSLRRSCVLNININIKILFSEVNFTSLLSNFLVGKLYSQNLSRNVKVSGPTRFSDENIRV